MVGKSYGISKDNFFSIWSYSSITHFYFIASLSENNTKFMLISALSCTLYHAWWMVPYTRLYPKQVLKSSSEKSDDTIRIMISNVPQTNNNYDGFLEIVHNEDPDLLVTLESNY
jgi:hypothetical protein